MALAFLIKTMFLNHLQIIISIICQQNFDWNSKAFNDTL
jgi:hypothetical protein